MTSHSFSLSGLVLGMTLAATASAQRHAVRVPSREVRVYVDGRAVRFDRVRPLFVGRRILVPLRGVFEKLGASVVYDPRHNRVLAKRRGTNIVLPLSRRTAYVNGRPHRLDAWPKISHGHVLVPIRFVAEALDAGVVYSASDRTVRIHPH